MRNETVESFEWVFREFLTLMGGVHPQTILTSNSRIKKIFFWKEHDKLSNRTVFTSPQKYDNMITYFRPMQSHGDSFENFYAWNSTLMVQVACV